MSQGFGDVDAGACIDRGFRITSCDDARAVFSDESSNVRARVSETMNRHTCVLQAHSFHTTSFTQRVETTARSRFRASLRAAERDWLAGDDAELSMTTHHRDRVHDPRHCLLIGVNVRRGYVAIRADDRRDLESVTSRQSLQLVT